jgi:nucleoside-diphosphate-sugar epimerase
MHCLVTGGAGFIGSNIVERLLSEGHTVKVLDNFSTGNFENIEEFTANSHFTYTEGTITDYDICEMACEGMDVVFHEAALVSVPLSVDDPVATYEINVKGTSNVFLAAHRAGIQRVVWASSTAVYGNSEQLPNIETQSLEPLSPYAATKAAGEMLASAYSACYNMSIIGLRYFNVYGKRQDPESPYAAAIPIFISMLLRGKTPVIFGDGEQTRDFVHVDDVVQANIKAAFDAPHNAGGQACNIGGGSEISINKLYDAIKNELDIDITPEHGEPRAGDVRFSRADITKASNLFGYEPQVGLEEGLKRSVKWYKNAVKQ